MTLLPRVPKLFNNSAVSLRVPRVLTSMLGSTEENETKKKTLDVNDIITEVETVGEKVHSAIQHTKNENFDIAMQNLIEGARITSCGLCKRELTRDASLLNHAKTTCRVGFSDECEELKKKTIEYMEEFNNKLPKRTEIKRKMMK